MTPSTLGRAAALAILASLLCTYGGLSQPASYPYPKREVRAVWITTVDGLDWPKPGLSVAQQQRSLHDIFEKLADAHFNTVYFQVRDRGDALYESSFEPWSELLSGTAGKNPGWDPLKFAIEEAHAHGMELHAWFNTFLVRSSSSRPPVTSPPHIIARHPEWVHLVKDGWWLDPGIPAARMYTLDVAMEIVRKYNVDGIHFDFMRYPESGIEDEESFHRYGNRFASKADWRRENVDDFISAFYDSATALKPLIKIGSAPIGVYHNFPGVTALQSYDILFQDSREWLKRGKQDYVVPQVYWSLGRTSTHPDFAAVARDWSLNTFGRHVYIGVGAYKADVGVEIPALIDTTRALGLPGNSFFRFGSLAELSLSMGARYRYPAFIPPMPWKDSIPPNPPSNMRVASADGNIFRIQWGASPAARDGDTAKYVNIYRSSVRPVDVNDIRNLVVSIAAGARSYDDTITARGAAKYYYEITGMDEANNESAPTHETGVILPAIVQLAQRLAPAFSLATPYQSGNSDYSFFTYELTTAGPVWLTLMDPSDHEVMRVVDAVQQPGRYVVTANVEKLKADDYTVLLTASGIKLKKTLTVSR
jgi:uncharacterized lipoprotein YddW (UPF0748 family)